MKIGMPTLIELETLEENVELCKNLGLDFVEINLNLPNFQELSSETLIELKEKQGVFFTFHAAEDIDMAHFNPKIRGAHLETIAETIELMKMIGSSKINMHMNKGIHFTLPDQKIHLYEKFKDQYLQSVLAFSDFVTEAIGNSEIVLLIENTGIYNSDFIVEALDILLKNEKIALTWDIGHDHVNTCSDRPYLMEKSSRIRHMHMHDASGKRDHLTLYTGELDLDNYIRYANDHNIDIVIETKTIESLRQSAARFQEALTCMNITK